MISSISGLPGYQVNRYKTIITFNKEVADQIIFCNNKMMLKKNQMKSLPVETKQGELF